LSKIDIISYVSHVLAYEMPVVPNRGQGSGF